MSLKEADLLKKGGFSTQKNCSSLNPLSKIKSNAKFKDENEIFQKKEQLKL